MGPEPGELWHLIVLEIGSNRDNGTLELGMDTNYSYMVFGQR